MATVTNVTFTLEDMRQQVYFMLSEEQGGVFSDDNIRMALNMGFASIYKKAHKNSVTISTLTQAGIRGYEIPDARLARGRAQIEGAWIGTEELAAEDWSFDVDADDRTKDDLPTGYSVDGNTIYLIPTPDSAYTFKVKYRREFVPMMEDTDTVNMTDVEIMAGIMYASYLLKMKDEEFETAGAFRSEYENLMKEVSSIQTGVFRATGRTSYEGMR